MTSEINLPRKVMEDIAKQFDEIARMAEEGDAHLRLGRVAGRTDVTGSSALQRIKIFAGDNARVIREAIGHNG